MAIGESSNLGSSNNNSSTGFLREASYDMLPYTPSNTDSIGMVQEWESENFFLIHSRAAVKKDVSFKVKHKKPYVQLFFLLKGAEWRSEFRGGSQIALYENEYALFYLPDALERTIYWSATDQMELFVVNIDASFYFDRFQSEGPMQDLKQRLVNGEVMQRLPIAGKMHEIIGAMIYLSCNAFLKKFHLETKVSELALVQLEQILLNETDADRRSQDKAANEEMMQKMYAIRSYLHQHSKEQHSLKKLAMQINSNATYLKENFRLVFGVSVFQYINQVRMQKAQRLLSSSDMSVAQIADEVGYKYQTHFTAAFKKYFGFLPKEVRR